MADLDRLITLVVRGEGTRDNFNRLVPGAEVFRGVVWAELRVAALELDSELGGPGIRLAGDRTYRIRWREDVAIAFLPRLDVIDDFDIRYNLSRVTPVDRRRYLDLDCVRQQ